MTSYSHIWLPDLAPGADGPQPIERTRVLNDGLVVGRLLGADVAPAIAILDQLDDGRRLSPDEQRALATIYDDAKHRLAAAIDDAGRAHPAHAAALLGSPAVARDANDVLYLRPGHDTLIDLLHTLDQLATMFAVAEARGLAIEIEYS